MKNIRIAHVCLRYPPATGGVETYVQDIVELTRDIPSRDVRVLTSKMRTHGPITNLDPELLLDDPPYVQRLHHLATPFISYPRLQALPYYLTHHAPNIIHAHSFWYQAADTAARYATAHKLPFIFHPAYYENKTRRKPLWQMYKHTIGRQTFARANVVVTVSPHEQSLIEAAGFPVKRFAMIPPGIIITKYTHPRPNPFLKQSITGQVMLSIGRIAQSKGLDDIADIMPALLKLHPNLHWVIVGEDFGALGDLKKKVELNNSASHVHILGKVSEDEKIGALQNATLFVHPSYYEAFGIVLAEALACRTPIVARHTAAIPYVVPHNHAGLLFATPTELREAISALLTQPTLAKRLSSHGYQHVTDHFTWDKSIVKILSLYEELIPH